MTKHIHLEEPSDRACIESFNDKLRDECLDKHWFSNAPDAKERTEAWADLISKFVLTVLLTV